MSYTVILEINAIFVNFVSHPSVRIIKKIIIFVNAIINANVLVKFVNTF